MHGTRTRGLRVQSAARSLGEGVYTLVRHDRHTHLAYEPEFPYRPGDVQREFRIEQRGSYVVVVKNPDAPRLLWAGFAAASPEELQERFRGRRYAELDPDFLDHPGARS